MKQVITKYPNKILFEKTRDIPKDQIKAETYSQIGSSMLETLKSTNGIGLSANQVGLPLNMCVTNVIANDVKIILNPRIIKQSNEVFDSREGCLSLPAVSLKIKRHKSITVEYETVDGETKQEEFYGLDAAVLQHEIDHLKGILITNRVSEYHRNKALKSLHKYMRFNKGKK